MRAGKKVVAIDGGGTKTSVCLMSLEDGSKKYHDCGPSNYKLVGTDRTKESLVGQVMAFLHANRVSVDDIECMVYGIAGLDTVKDEAVYRDIICTTGVEEKRLVLCNDAEMAFRTVGDPPGVVLVAGTGSIAFAFNEGRTFRCGGWGSPFSDIGSGIWIGIRLLQYAIPYCDGYAPHDPVYDVCLEMVGAADKESFLNTVTEYGLDQVGGFARIVLEQAAEGNDLCSGIVDEAVEALANLVSKVLDKAGLTVGTGFGHCYDCVLSGGLVNHGMFYERLKQRIEESDSQLRIVRYEGKPVDGGISIALDSVGK